jgi:hypothetical protein
MSDDCEEAAGRRFASHGWQDIRHQQLGDVVTPFSLP